MHIYEMPPWESEVPPAYPKLPLDRSPKSCALPVVAIVIYCIVFTYAPPPNTPRIELSVHDTCSKELVKEPKSSAVPVSYTHLTLPTNREV